MATLFFAHRVRAQPILEAITFIVEPGRLYIPVAEAVAHLRWQMRRDDAGHCTHIQEREVPPGAQRLLVDGTDLIELRALEGLGARIQMTENGAVVVSDGRRRFLPVADAKRVEINLKEQQLRAWQGNRLVLHTHISSGRHGSTPAEDFVAGPFRSRMHYSSRYHHAPMPWSVQIYGHIFIHGFTSVPDYPASHGCIRVPLTGRNPAKFFFEWADNGTPVRVIKE